MTMKKSMLINFIESIPDDYIQEGFESVMCITIKQSDYVHYRIATCNFSEDEVADLLSHAATHISKQS